MKRIYLGGLNWGSLCGGLSCGLSSRGLSGGLAEIDQSMQIFNGEENIRFLHRFSCSLLDDRLSDDRSLLSWNFSGSLFFLNRLLRCRSSLKKTLSNDQCYAEVKYSPPPSIPSSFLSWGF